MSNVHGALKSGSTLFVVQENDQIRGWNGTVLYRELVPNWVK